MSNQILAHALERMGVAEYNVSGSPLSKAYWSVTQIIARTGWTTLEQTPEIAVVLGSGLGGFEKRLHSQFEIPFHDVGLPAPGIPGHSGRLCIGTLSGHRVAVLAGRVHYYEGHDFETVCRATRVMALLGVPTLLLSNAAGGINPDFAVGDLMLIRDHLNLMGDNPLRGPNPGNLGPRFPDMTTAWTPAIRQVFKEQAARLGLTLKEGVYAANCGPTYETPAEVRMLKAIGADAVGMSTAPEAIAARHAGMRVGGVSVVTNAAAGTGASELSHEEVKEVGAAAGVKLGDLFEAVIADGKW
ncbi:MAG TPA: purine-nucleoside phosphorylase [Myxococcota bacterium]|nr:purine-nucleoside phosphorylase [Myxococcota bacterium]HOD08305.1 purine-nucleoside phosphorylase [Myxococcota bacterium]HPB50813.1 purine-nucleoside phosphorylase [Myxococcota bacterium]HQP94632.1 purine-nucleoside phosphorylase [Myxococcota bacterium]